MSKPESDAPKRMKRPRGLLASRRAAGHSADLEPAAKKARADDGLPQDQDELKIQDWQDLEELFENALDALYGSNWTSAIPLVRGVLHECARLVSLHQDPTLVYSPLEGDSEENADPVPASAFYTIYASAWSLMSTFARNDASLLADDEPAEPLEYILSALAACEKGQQALEIRKQPRVWDLELTWGRALVIAAQSFVDSEDGAQTTTADQNQLNNTRARYTGPNASTALDRAFQHLLYATKHRPTGLIGNETEEERAGRDDRFARMLLETAQGLLAVADLQSSMNQEEGQQACDKDTSRHLDNARNLFVHLEQLSNIPPEVQTQAILGAAQAGLAIGSTMAESLEDDEQASDVEGSKDEDDERSMIRNSAIQTLKQAIEGFDRVRELYSTKEGASKIQAVNDDEIKPLLQEALVTLATLLPEGPEQEAMYARYREEGGVLDDDSPSNNEE